MRPFACERVVRIEFEWLAVVGDGFVVVRFVGIGDAAISLRESVFWIELDRRRAPRRTACMHTAGRQQAFAAEAPSA